MCTQNGIILNKLTSKRVGVGVWAQECPTPTLIAHVPADLALTDCSDDAPHGRNTLPYACLQNKISNCALCITHRCSFRPGNLTLPGNLNFPRLNFPGNSQTKTSRGGLFSDKNLTSSQLLVSQEPDISFKQSLFHPSSRPPCCCCCCLLSPLSLSLCPVSRAWCDGMEALKRDCRMLETETSTEVTAVTGGKVHL